jgi:hypothetical protein
MRINPVAATADAVSIIESQSYFVPDESDLAEVEPCITSLRTGQLLET